MDRRFRFSSLLRARQAQEDVARGELVRAYGETRRARDGERRQELALRATSAPPAGQSRAVVAALVARHSLAATLAAARQGVLAAEEVAAERSGDLAEAARRRRAVEKLAERHAAARRAADLAAAQRDLDELAATQGLRGILRGESR